MSNNFDTVLSNNIYKQVPTPCYVVSEKLLKKNLDLRNEIELKVREHYGIANDKKKKEEVK